MSSTVKRGIYFFKQSNGKEVAAGGQQQWSGNSNLKVS